MVDNINEGTLQTSVGSRGDRGELFESLCRRGFVGVTLPFQEQNQTVRKQSSLY